LSSGTIYMCPAWADQVLDQKSKGLLPASIKLAVLDPPLTGSYYQLSIPALSPKKEAAFKFLNYVASVEAQDIFVRVMKAIPVIDPSKLPAETMQMLSGLQPVYRVMTVGGLDGKMKERWSKEIGTLK
jgi:putative spermidine/putrescine transport system substrate-binding protein